MKQALFILLLVYICTSALCQTILPDLEIGGVSNIRSFVYKKDLEPTLPDSSLFTLPLFYPLVVKQHEEEVNNESRNAWIGVNISSQNHFTATFSAYRENSKLEMIKYQATTIRPYTYYGFTQGDVYLSLRSKAQSSLINSLGASFFQTDYRNHQIQNLSIQGYNQVESVTWFNIEIEDVFTSIDYCFTQQHSPIYNINLHNLNINHRSRIKTGQHEIHTVILGSNSNPGGLLKIKRSGFPIEAPNRNFGIGVLADEMRAIPFVDFGFVFIDGLHRSLMISNQAIISKYDQTNAAIELNWFNMPKRLYLTKTPLNLLVSYSELTRGEKYTWLDTVTLSNRTSINYEAPIITGSPIYPIPSLSFKNTWENTSILETWHSLGRIAKLQNSFGMSFGKELQSNSFGLPYSPRFDLKTVFTTNYKPMSYMISLDQRYGIKDHNSEYIPEEILLNIASDWSFDSDGRLGIEIRNLLNRPYFSFKGMPSKGIGIHLNYSQRF